MVRSGHKPLEHARRNGSISFLFPIGIVRVAPDLHVFDWIFMNVIPIKRSIWYKIKAFIKNERKLAKLYFDKYAQETMVKHVRPTIYIVQRSAHFWYIESDKGHIMMDHLHLDNMPEVESFVKKFVSRTDWLYEIKPLKEIKR